MRPTAGRRPPGLTALWLGLSWAAATAGGAERVAAVPVARVEARSADLLAVGVVRDDQMVIHLSRLIDNAPVRDAVVNVLLRGVVHPTAAAADGSYELETTDLRLPGAAAVEFRVAGGEMHENLKGTLEVNGSDDKPQDKNSARQLWWWILNFAVCIGFLMLWSRRRRAIAAREAAEG